VTAPLVSVVVPSYQQAGYIEATVESVLGQDGVAFELVVADHSSSDGTWEILQRFAGDPRVRLLRTAPGGGAAANWAAATSAARGSLLKLLPGDDTLRPGTLARQAGLLQDHPRAVLVAGRRDVVDARGKVVARGRGLQGLRATMTGGEAIRAAVRSGTNPFGEPGAVMLRKDALVAAGGWAGDWSYAIDVATYFHVLEHGDFVRDDDVASTFRVSAGQWSVALVQSQAREIGRLFTAAAQRHSSVTSRDVRLGSRRARLQALQRRIFYTVMKGRMG
jgi:glycosyltransferase involved in cell wall biosynthesis